jgi:hypothetical protein
MPFSGTIVGAGINIIVNSTPTNNNIRIYAANYTSGSIVWRQEIGSYNSTAGDIGSLYYDVVNGNAAANSRNGILARPGSLSTINFFNGEYIGIFVESISNPGGQVFCAIEGTLYLQTS